MGDAPTPRAASRMEGGTDIRAARPAIMMVGRVMSVKTNPPTRGTERGNPNALANDFVYPDPGALVIFPDNHDMSRIFTQLDEDYGLYKIAMAYVLTMRGAPQIYYGTEILMANPGTDSHGIIRSDFPGGWQGDLKNAFTGAGLGETERDAQAYVRTLLKWRQNKVVIHTGELTHFRPRDGIYVYFRHNENESVMVILNKNDDPSRLQLERFEERLKGYTKARDVVENTLFTLDDELQVAGRSALVLELR